MEHTMEFPKIRNIRHVLAVSDLVASTEYCLTNLGFERDFSVGGWEFLSFGDFQVMLGECPDEVPASKTNNHSYFAHVLVDDADEIYSEFKTSGATFTSQIENKPWAHREFGVVTPEGHRIVFAHEIGG